MSSFRLALASFTVLASAAAPIFAATTPALIALSGATAPGGGTYSAFTNPTISSAGKVAFLAGLGGGTSNGNLFVGTPGSVQAVALNGTAAPAGGNFNLINSTLLIPQLNASGQAVFSSSLTGGTSTSGVFTGTPGSLSAVALQGNAAPAGGNYTLPTAPPAINNAGTVAFTNTLTGGTSASGVFVGAPGSLTAAALLGGTTPSGGVYATVFTAPTLNASGQVAFISLNGSSQGIFAGTPGSLQTVMLQGTVAPGTGGATYGAPAVGFSYNNANQAAFSAALTLPDTTASTGVFAGAAGSVQAVAIRNTAAPAGGNYGPFAVVSINGNGKVAFTSSSMTGGSSTAGLFFGAPGSLQALALQGAATPLTGTTYASFTSVVPNGLDYVAFIANLTNSPTVGTFNDSVLFVAGPGGAVYPIVREGEGIDVDPTAGVDLRIVSGAPAILVGSGGQDGKSDPFNDSNVIAYKLTFTDGSTGIFTSSVPEPTSLGLFAAGAGILLRRVGRRSVQSH